MRATASIAVDGAPSASPSAIVAGVARGHHLLNVQCTNSRTFRVGGHTWHVEYYPTGINSEDTGYISLFLVLGGTVAEIVKAQTTISLLEGNPVHSLSTGVVNFSEKRRWGYTKFVKHECLEESTHLKNNGSEVTVMKELRAEETPLVVVPPSDMHRHFGDLEIICSLMILSPIGCNAPQSLSPFVWSSYPLWRTVNCMTSIPVCTKIFLKNLGAGQLMRKVCFSS